MAARLDIRAKLSEAGISGPERLLLGRAFRATAEIDEFPNELASSERVVVGLVGTVLGFAYHAGNDSFEFSISVKEVNDQPVSMLVLSVKTGKWTLWLGEMDYETALEWL